MSRKDRIDWTGFLEKRKRCDRKITWREIQMMVTCYAKKDSIESFSSVDSDIVVTVCHRRFVLVGEE